MLEPGKSHSMWKCSGFNALILFLVLIFILCKPQATFNGCKRKQLTFILGFLHSAYLKFSQITKSKQTQTSLSKPVSYFAFVLLTNRGDNSTFNR